MRWDAMRAVMDTNVLVAALRSRDGASYEILRRLLIGEWQAVISNHLLFEYVEVLGRQGQFLELSLGEISELLDAVCARAETWPLFHEWTPILMDADDEPLVQLAVESKACKIVSHNIRHLQPARALGVELLKPRDFLAILSQ